MTVDHNRSRLQILVPSNKASTPSQTTSRRCVLKRRWLNGLKCIWRIYFIKQSKYSRPEVTERWGQARVTGMVISSVPLSTAACYLGTKEKAKKLTWNCILYIFLSALTAFSLLECECVFKPLAWKTKSNQEYLTKWPWGNNFTFPSLYASVPWNVLTTCPPNANSFRALCSNVPSYPWCNLFYAGVCSMADHHHWLIPFEIEPL